MIGFVGKVMMSCSGGFFCSALMSSIVMNSSGLWSLSLDSVSTFILFTVSVVVCDHLSASVWTLLNFLMFDSSFTFCVWWFLWNILWFPEWYNDVCFGGFMMKRQKPFAGFFCHL